MDLLKVYKIWQHKHSGYIVIESPPNDIDGLPEYEGIPFDDDDVNKVPNQITIEYPSLGKIILKHNDDEIIECRNIKGPFIRSPVSAPVSAFTSASASAPASASASAPASASASAPASAPEKFYSEFKACL